MRVLLTGAAGFLGWHTRVRLRALTDHEVVVVTRDTWDDLPRLAKGIDTVIHCAGVNRGDDRDVERDNIELARGLAEAVAGAGSLPHLVYANSIQAGNGSPYGTGKAAAGQILSGAARAAGGSFTDVLLPNLFGEHGRPRYNSFVATFADAVVHGRPPTVVDREVALLHAQGAAAALLDGMTGASARLAPAGHPTSVQGVLDFLQEAERLYRTGDIPSLPGQFETDLFNTLRAAKFPHGYPIALTPHSDARGRLVETVRSHGGQGQTFLSTTRPGITRGEHFHLGKIERFVVVAGSARIRLRRLFTDTVLSFDVTGDQPVIIDMPTMWAHNITNTGDDELTTMFWTHTLFDPAHPDTYPEPVAPARPGGDAW